MDIHPKEFKKNQWVLVAGLVVLILPVLLSISRILQLEEDIEIRRQAFELRGDLDDIDAGFKDWILHARQGAGLSEEKKKLRQQEIESHVDILFDRIIGKLSTEPEQLRRLYELKSGWQDLVKSPPHNYLEGIYDLDRRIIDLDRHQFERIKSRDLEVVEGIRRPLFLMSTMVLLSLVMIIYSLRASAQENLRKYKLFHEMLRLQEETKAALSMKSRFLATVSHEIRTPLNGIIGISDVLRRSPMEEKDHRLIEVVYKSGKTLLRIINDILDFSKIEAGRFDFEEVEFDLVDILNRVRMTLLPRAEKKSLTLNFDIDPFLPKKLFGDADRLTQVLFNLLGNAIKFTSVGSIDLKVEKKSSQDKSPVKISFSVTDTGIGISYEHIQDLFKPFTQIHKVGTSGEAGTGLGLSISQSLVQAMGGSIHVASSFGQGSCFYFELEFTNFSEETIGSTSSIEINETPRKNHRPVALSTHLPRARVLIVEDNPTNQLIAQTMLDQFKVESLLASDGQECLEIVEKYPVDLILMDCQMPKMDGFEATVQLRKKGVITPVIAMTANASTEDKEKCRLAGMDGFVTKPITLEALAEELSIQFEKVAPKDDARALDELAKKIGRESAKRVARSFIATLPTFRTSVESYCLQNQLVELNKLGHKYKSSSQTVGANRFSAECKELENVGNIDEAIALAKDLSERSKEIELLMTSKAREYELHS